MPHTLLAAVEAIFVIMDLPKLTLLPYTVDLDKWLLLEVCAVQILLGLFWDTRNMAVSITHDFRVETVWLLQHTWHDDRE